MAELTIVESGKAIMIDSKEDDLLQLINVQIVDTVNPFQGNFEFSIHRCSFDEAFYSCRGEKMQIANKTVLMGLTPFRPCGVKLEMNEAGLLKVEAMSFKQFKKFHIEMVENPSEHEGMIFINPDRGYTSFFGVTQNQNDKNISWFQIAC